MLKAPFVLKIFEIFFKLFKNIYFFGPVRNWLHKKAKFDLKIYDVTTWIRSNYSTNIAQYFKK